jgi:hypothetical protein
MVNAKHTSLEEQLLSAGDVDRENLAELAKILFVMNGWKPGPIAGSYMVICTKPDEEWCVGQLWADQEQPFRIFEHKRYPSPDQAQAAAEALKAGEEAPP